jgi:hypothetical protein
VATRASSGAELLDMAIEMTPESATRRGPGERWLGPAFEVQLAARSSAPVATSARAIPCRSASGRGARPPSLRRGAVDGDVGDRR